MKNTLNVAHISQAHTSMSVQRHISNSKEFVKGRLEEQSENESNIRNKVGGNKTREGPCFIAEEHNLTN